MKKQAFLFIILASLLWGTSGIFVHYLSPLGFSPLHMAFFRTSMSSLVIFLYIFFRDKKLFKTDFTTILLYALNGFCLFGAGAFYYTSMQATSVSTAVVLMYTSPVMVMVFSVLFLGEKFGFLKGISVFCMLLGCCLVSGVIGGFEIDTYGIFMGLMSGVSYASYNIITKILMKRKCNPLTTVLYSFIFASLGALSLCKIWQVPSLISDNIATSLPLLLTIGLATGVTPYFLYTLSLKTLPAGTATSLGIVEPMAATLYSVILFGEKLSIYSISGFILIMSSVFMLGRAEK